jgi:hypothetical protein
VLLFRLISQELRQVFQVDHDVLAVVPAKAGCVEVQSADELSIAGAISSLRLSVALLRGVVQGTVFCLVFGDSCHYVLLLSGWVSEKRSH